MENFSFEVKFCLFDSENYFPPELLGKRDSPGAATNINIVLILWEMTLKIILQMLQKKRSLFA